MPTTHLASLEPGQIGTIFDIQAESSLYQRLQALGFRPGRQVMMIRGAWFSGPLHIRIGTTEMMLRRCEAEKIRIQNIITGNKAA